MSTENCHCGTDDQKFISLIGMDTDNTPLFQLYDNESKQLVSLLLDYDPATNLGDGQLNISSTEELFVGFSNDEDLDLTTTTFTVNADGQIETAGELVQATRPSEEALSSSNTAWIGFFVDKGGVVQGQFEIGLLPTVEVIGEIPGTNGILLTEDEYKLLQSIAYAYAQRPALTNAITLLIDDTNDEQADTLLQLLEAQNGKLYHCDNNPFETIQQYDKLRDNITQAQTELLCKSNGILKGLGHIEAFIGMREHIRKLICTDESSLGTDLDGFGKAAASVTVKTAEWMEDFGEKTPCFDQVPDEEKVGEWIIDDLSSEEISPDDLSPEDISPEGLSS